MLKINNVSVSFDRNGSGMEALSRVTLSVGQGELLCIVGPSGCGKTTLLEVAAGILKPQEGDVLINDEAIGNPSRRIGLVFQQNTLFPWLSVEKNVEFALRSRTPWSEREERHLLTKNLIADVGLLGFESARPGALSGGMMQRANLARALAAAPEVLLLDEPFGALDMASKLEMHDLLLDVWKRYNMSIVFVTHDLDEAVALGDRIAVMSKRPGRILEYVAVELERPRIRKGIRCRGFEEIRNQVLKSSADFFLS